jgi:hypothetical protein
MKMNEFLTADKNVTAEDFSLLVPASDRNDGGACSPEISARNSVSSPSILSTFDEGLEPLVRKTSHLDANSGTPNSWESNNKSETFS